MQRFLTLFLLVALSGLGSQVVGQQQQPQNQPSSPQPQAPADQSSSPQPQAPADQPGSQPQQTAASPQSAETFRGTIVRTGNQLVFQEAKSQTTFPVDDQAKVAPFEGKSVQLTATVDAKTSSLHVVNVSPSGK